MVSNIEFDSLDEVLHVGSSTGHWPSLDDFVSTEEGPVKVSDLKSLGFPRDWPAVYSASSVLKSLIGKKGKLPCRRAAVAGEPTPEQRSQATASSSSSAGSSILRRLLPAASRENAEKLKETCPGLGLVQGWAVFECLDRPTSAAFVAEKYWWNSLPDGTWVDLTPRPKDCTNLLLVETVSPSTSSRRPLRSEDWTLFSQILAARYPQVKFKVSGPKPERQFVQQPRPAVAEKPAPPKKGLDYSKWDAIEDSDDEDVAAGREEEEMTRNGPVFGVKDLAEGKPLTKQPPIPDYLAGNSGGGGATNCYTSLCKLLDRDMAGDNDQSHSLSQTFGKSFRSAILDVDRQRFYRDAIDKFGASSFVIVLGIGSILPMLQVARRTKASNAVLLEASSVLSSLATSILKANDLALEVRTLPNGYDDEVAVRDLLKPLFKSKKISEVVIVTELFAPDLLSSGLIPASLSAHAAVKSALPSARIKHLPRTVELFASPLELRSDRLGPWDIRPFNMVRNTSSNDKADFWWWPVRLDNQPCTNTAILGPEETLCGFDLDRAAEIGYDEVRRRVQFQITTKGRCNSVAMWWSAKYEDLEYSTRPALAKSTGASGGLNARSEWKQAVHYLAGETAVFVGDRLEVLVSLTPRFTVRMMQQMPFSVESPAWVKAPNLVKCSATLPILPYHFLMLTDKHRLEVYAEAIRSAVRQQRKRLGRRVRVLDAGAGLGLLGMTAALEGADVWLCEAVPLMRQLCREVLGANAKDIADKQGLVQLLPPMMSTRLEVGTDVPHKFDVVVSEVLDLWGLGEGVLPTMRHAHKNLLADGGSLLPSRLVVFAQPLELQLWGDAERAAKAKLEPLSDLLRSKFSPMRLNQVPYRPLSESPAPVLEIDFQNLPEQVPDGTPNLDNVQLCIRMGGRPALRAKMTAIGITTSGMLNGYGVWWAADLNNGHLITSAPSSPQRSWKQLVRWIEPPRFVSEGEDVQVLSCYNENQVNVEDVHIPQSVLDQYQQELKKEGQAVGTAQQQQQQQQLQQHLQHQKQLREQQQKAQGPQQKPTEAKNKKKSKSSDAAVAGAVASLGEDLVEVD